MASTLPTTCASAPHAPCVPARPEATSLLEMWEPAMEKGTIRPPELETPLCARTMTKQPSSPLFLPSPLHGAKPPMRMPSTWLALLVHPHAPIEPRRCPAPNTRSRAPVGSCGQCPPPLQPIRRRLRTRMPLTPALLCLDLHLYYLIHEQHRQILA